MFSNEETNEVEDLFAQIVKMQRGCFVPLSGTRNDRWKGTGRRAQGSGLTEQGGAAFYEGLPEKAVLE